MVNKARLMEKREEIKKNIDFLSHLIGRYESGELVSNTCDLQYYQGQLEAWKASYHIMNSL